MKFVEIINHKKFTLISIFLFLYVIFNLLEGERGIISYYEKQKIKEQLIQEKKSLIIQLNLFEKKINLLTNKINLDYLEVLYRTKFVVGKTNEKIYVNNNEAKTSRKN
jgi:cell division protein FtsB